MSQQMHSTFFETPDGQSLGDHPSLLSIPLKVGMQITIHGHAQTFTVVDWKFHHGQTDEKSGLTVILK